jgi:RNA polymerase sigma factor for flagellar operon FliA
MVAPPAPHVVATQAEVEQRVRDNIPLVGYLVREKLRRLPPHVRREELMSAGLLALTLSAQQFDPDRGVSFASYASRRISGALLDELRGTDWAPRSVRRAARETHAVREQLTAALGRAPTKAEHAAALGISVADLDAAQDDTARAATTSLEALTPYAGAAAMADDTAGPEQLLLQREQLGYLHDAIAELPERLRHVITEHFFAQRQFVDIATELGVTASRVSQLYTEALRMIRDGMDAHLNPQLIDPAALSKRAAKRQIAYRDAIAQRSTLAGRLALTTPTADLRRDARLAVVA